MDARLTSDRVVTVAAATPFQLLYEFCRLSGYQERRHEPGVLDFTFGDPHDPPSEAYVEILRESLIPQHELWFAYNMGDAKRDRGRDRVAARATSASRSRPTTSTSRPAGSRRSPPP